MWKLNIKIIKTGSSTVDPGNTASMTEVKLKHQIGIGGGSTVTLIREEHEVLLIDTGYERESDVSEANDTHNRQVMLALLRLNGVVPEDVTKIYVTHFHRDHLGGIEDFPDATWICNRAALEEYQGPLKDRFVVADDGDEIIPHTRVMDTPGHTRGHSSILWTTANKSVRVAISGDAILDLAWLQSGYTWKFNSDFYDLGSARRSIKELLHGADIIIPGHGQPFLRGAGLRTLKED